MTGVQTCVLPICRLCAGCDALQEGMDRLDEAMRNQPGEGDFLESARYMHDVVLQRMTDLRRAADGLETVMDRQSWPFPTYDELLFNV